MSDIDPAVRDELLARIAFREHTIEKWSAGPSVNEHMARSHTGFQWFDIGFCRLLLGESAAARLALAQAAEWMYSSLEHVRPPTPSTISPALPTYASALEAAVMAGDRELAERYAADPVDPGPRPGLAGDRFQWGLALPFLVVGDDASLLAGAQAASAVPDDKAWYPGLGTAMAALASGDEAGLEAALARVLAKHVKYARAKKSWCYNSGYSFVCVPVTVIVAVARRRGTAPEILGRHARVPLAFVHSTEARSTPTATLEVDFVPDALTAT